ncbi:DNA adenine methylase [cf. Phormidesmis sp. LEGE 11477]|uniref:DNA adenine methylase n=1 Tax=cf. Phormidesmis sp. LEGE 11477 TaxID=1828680 RepID=UPI0018819BFE|nr:DNA adenine methylase [cf. Phormidesmis sp. LEGE 11477]MBE9064698.1 DNA adenine methylase [cf. Phormidesmis sp. LEGE 11477]
MVNATEILPIVTASPKPFVKWVGGKTQLLSELAKRVPGDFSRYYEPFLGGGALFFRLQPQRACLTDINPDLVNLYTVVRDKVDELIEDLGQHVYEKDYFYEVRGADRNSAYETWTDVQRASRFIYLNKTCYNGLYRVNSKGQFNVPFGRYSNPAILDSENLYACHAALQKTVVEVADFYSVRRRIRANDFVYFDPPYAPLSATAKFTSYTKGGFDVDMQYALRDLCRALDERSIRFMLSNSSAPLILDLYAEFNIEFVYATRSINSNAGKRGKIPEVVVTNYEH